MVGYDPKTPQDKTNADRIAAGAASGFFTRALVQPLDVIKIRFQLQLEPISEASQGSKYTSMLQAFRTVVQEEGIYSLWKGHVPAQCLSMVYGAVQFSGFHFLTEKYSHYLHAKSNPVSDFACGALAGCIATSVSHPFDVMRTRLIGQGEPKLYTGQRQAFVMIFKSEGFYGLYRGLIPNLLLIAPQTGAMFLSYKVSKRLWKEKMPSALADSWFQNFCCGALSGTIAKSCVYPLDSVKKRLQIQGFEQARAQFGSTTTYRGVIDCLVRISRHEGLLGLYKGFQPSLLKAALTTAIQFSFYEYFLIAFQKLTQAVQK